MKKQVEYLQKLFYDLWNDFGSVFLVVKHSDRTSIGKRGFTEEEKKNGLTLVFNSRTNNKLEWDTEGNLSCVLAFGTRKEEVFIHCDDLVSVFSPDASVQFVRNDMAKQPEPVPVETGEKSGEPSQVVSMDRFRKRKPGQGA
jgi:hypothetical protein